MKTNLTKFGLGLALMMILAGCVGYVDGGGGAVVVDGGPGPWWGGPWYHGHDVHAWSHRGAVSRGGGGGHRR